MVVNIRTTRLSCRGRKVDLTYVMDTVRVFFDRYRLCTKECKKKFERIV